MPCLTHPRLPASSGSRPSLPVRWLPESCAEISIATARRDVCRVRSMWVRRRSQSASPGGAPAAVARRRAARIRATVCLQSLPTGHEQLPLQSMCRPFDSEKTMVW